MVFTDPTKNNPSSLLYVYTYHPYWGGHNPNFDSNSSLILAVKRGEPHALQHFYDIIYPSMNTGSDIAIAIVPSHNPANTQSGIRTLAQWLTQHGRIDATGCLVRTQKIMKLTEGGDRSETNHLSTVQVVDPHLLAGKHVFLLDDVATTGNSLLACSKLLYRAGAASVKRMALGQTA